MRFKFEQHAAKTTRISTANFYERCKRRRERLAAAAQPEQARQRLDLALFPAW
jgi:hypothetical protein